MNSGSEQKLSLEELKQLHQPTTTQTPVQEQVAPSETHPTKEEWMEMIEHLDTLWYHTDLQTNLLKKVSGLLAQLPTRAQLDDLLKTVRHLEQMTEQAGKPKENSFSLHRIRLPRLHLPHVSIPALISLLMAAAALLLLWWGLGTVWSGSSLLSL